ncbi:MAG: hypothetical protein WDN27_02100 [Candidatus Saccharibacteria bacterium]
MNEKQTPHSETKPAIPKATGGISLDEPTVRPTKKQKELLGFIEAFIAEHGLQPELPRNHERA